MVPDASVDQKYTGKKRKRKGKYPLFIFRIRGLASNFNSIHFCPLNTILFQKLIFVKLNPSYRQKNRDSSTDRASLANNIKPVALTDRDFSNGASIIINLSVYVCIRVCNCTCVCLLRPVSGWENGQRASTSQALGGRSVYVGPLCIILVFFSYKINTEGTFYRTSRPSVCCEWDWARDPLPRARVTAANLAYLFLFSSSFSSSLFSFFFYLLRTRGVALCTSPTKLTGSRT